MKVTSKIFGTGTVISQDGGNITIDFNGTIKTLIVKFARLTNEDGTEFGEQFTAKAPKKSKHEKRIASIKRESLLTDSQKANRDRNYARFIKEMNQAELAENFLPSQIESKKYNKNLIN